SVRPWATGHSAALGSLISPSTASRLSATSDTGLLSGSWFGGLRRRPRGARRLLAGRAHAPVDDLRLIDHVRVVVQRRKARRLTDGAVDVGDLAAAAAYDMVMVVADARLV